MCGVRLSWRWCSMRPGSWDGDIPGKGRTRIVVAGAPPPTHHRAHRDRARLEVIWTCTGSPYLLVMNRSRGGVRRPHSGERASRLSRAGALWPSASRWPSMPKGSCSRWGNATSRTCTQPEATAAAILDGWFHTGDGGSIDDEGYVTISHRKKYADVSSIEIEDTLFSHPAVDEVAVIGAPDEKWGETVVACRRARTGRVRDRGRAEGSLPREAVALQGPTRIEFRQLAGPHRHGQAAEVQAPGSLLGSRTPGQRRRPGPMGGFIAPAHSLVV